MWSLFGTVWFFLQRLKEMLYWIEFNVCDWKDYKELLMKVMGFGPFILNCFLSLSFALVLRTCAFQFVVTLAFQKAVDFSLCGKQHNLSLSVPIIFISLDLLS